MLSFHQRVELISNRREQRMDWEKPCHPLYDPGVTEDQLYHLCASGIFDSIQIFNNGDRVTSLSGPTMAQFCAAVDAKRETRVKVDVAYQPALLSELKKHIEDTVGAVVKAVRK